MRASDRPVTLPPGCARLLTSPVPSASPAVAMTMGIVRVAAVASGATKRLTARTTASPISGMRTSVGMAGGESSRTPRRAPAQRRSSSLFDDLIRSQQKRLRDRETERLRGLQVDDQLELRR